MLLAPSAIATRRPSGEADRILSRIEPGPPFCRRPLLPASGSVQSVPRYGECWTQEGEYDDVAAAGGSTEIRSDGDRTLTATAEEKEEEEDGDDDPSFGTLGIGPDARTKYWNRRSSQGLKGDPSGAGAGPGSERRCPGEGESRGFRRASLSLRRSIDSMLCTLATKPPSRGGGGGGAVQVERTRLSMEVIEELPIVRRKIRSKQKGKTTVDKEEEASRGEDAGDGDDSSGPPSSNLSLSLVLVSLKDGVLSAEISISELQRIPHGHVKIRIRNYNLEVCVTEESGSAAAAAATSSSSQRDGGGREKQQQQQPWYRGSVSIPIYVNPSSLQFRLDDSRGVVHLEGRIKGCCTRMGTSLSAMELSRSATASSSVVTGNGSS